MPASIGSTSARPRASRRFRQIAIVVTTVFLVCGGLPLLTSGASAQGQQFVVAPNGLSTGNGSVLKPLSLEKALAKTGPVRSGDQILMRGGVYPGTYTSAISGLPSAPIVVRSYPNEWAVFDNNTVPKPPLTITGADTWFRDFEVTKSDPKRISAQAGAIPRDISRGGDGAYSAGDGITVSGPRTKLINLVVHDAGNGIVSLKQATDSEIYGCVLYNNGFLGADKAWGHAVYVKNQTGTKRITDSVMFNNWAFGIHGYAPYENITDLTIEGVTSFGNGTPVDVPVGNIHVGPGTGTLDRIVVRSNVGYHRAPRGDNFRLGFANDSLLAQNGSLTLEGNALIGGRNALVMQGWKSATVRNNTFRAAPADPGTADMAKVLTNSVDGPGYQWDANTYIDPNMTTGTYPPAFARGWKDPSRGWSGWRFDFASWVKTYGYDRASAFVKSSTTPVQVHVRPNRYEVGRAFMTVINHGGAAAVELPLAGTGLRAGQAFQIRDVQNLSGAPVATGVYDGRGVSVSMTSTSVMQPIGGSPTPVSHTPAEFGVFEVRPTSS